MRATVLWICLALASLALTACGREDRFEDINARVVTLPDGTRIHAEVKADRQSQAVGMMYRDAMPAGGGMLFVYRSPQREPYWMFNCKIPLDIAWLDQEGKVVELAANAPPCEKPAKECPSYGGHEAAVYVLELGGGQAKLHGVEPGKILRL